MSIYFDPSKLEHGLYRLHWLSGGTSLASVGSTATGSRWFSPTNWQSPETPPKVSSTDWTDVERVEFLVGNYGPDSEQKEITMTHKYEIDRRYEFELTWHSVCPVPEEAIVTLWFSDGSILSGKRAGDCDWYGIYNVHLTHFMVTEYPPEKHTAWVNVYRGSVYEDPIVLDVFLSKEDADKVGGHARMACKEFEWYDGEGLE